MHYKCLFTSLNANDQVQVAFIQSMFPDCKV